MPFIIELRDFMNRQGAKGLLLVSGSRSITDGRMSRAVCYIAKNRQWGIIVGDAIGVDTSIALNAHNMGIPLAIVGCEAVGRLRMRGNWHEQEKVITHLYPGGDKRGSCYVIRDKGMANLTAQFANRGFMGIWDGQSKGTIHAANAAKALGIAGIIYNVSTGDKEIWK